MTNQDQELVVSYLTLRQMIGWVGLLMPAAVRLGAIVFEGIHSTNSISAYYYTGMRDVFVSTLVLTGALLSCYRTPSRSDNFIAIVAGIAAAGIGLFPMDPVYAAEVLRNHPGMTTAECYVNRGILGYHFIFVTIFLCSLSTWSISGSAHLHPAMPRDRKSLETGSTRSPAWACSWVWWRLAFCWPSTTAGRSSGPIPSRSPRLRQRG
jgi:hypothetical protein